MVLLSRPRAVSAIAVLAVASFLLPSVAAAQDSQQCAVGATAKGNGTGQVMLDLYAPCKGGSAVTVFHEGLAFTDKLGSDGRVSINMPVLANPALMIAAFADGSSTSASTSVDGMSGVSRAELSWDGPAQVTLTGVPTNQVETFGMDGQRRLAVATFQGTNPGAIQAEISLTPASCNTPLTARSVLKVAGRAPVYHDISMMLPPCDDMKDGMILDLPQMFSGAGS